MRAISYWRPALGALAVFGFALNVSGADRLGKSRQIERPDNYGGQFLTPGPGNPLLAPANACPGEPGGVLPAAGGTLAGDTYDAGDDFDGSLYPDGCGYSYGPSGNDEIWEFTVESGGRWTFDTCTIPAGYDTSIGITYDIGIGCPGVGLICNGDDACGASWESAIRDVCLYRNQTYWLIVDGWSPASYFPGTYYEVTYARTVDPCEEDADCANGILCDGVEQCVDGCCYPGPAACPCWADCNEDTQECVNNQDDCTAALNGVNSGYTATQGCENAGIFSPGGGCEMFWKCDDIEVWEGAGDKLISYTLYFQARWYASWEQCVPLGYEFLVETAIFEGTTDGSCLPDGTKEIPGTRCSFTGVVTDAGDPPQEAHCEPGGGMQSGIVLPNRSGDTDNCEIDFYVCLRSEIVSGFMITAYGGPDGGCTDDDPATATAEERVGGPAASDDFGVDVMFYEGSDAWDDPQSDDTACRSGVFVSSWFGGQVPSDFADLHICTEPVGVCCSAAGGCDVVAEKDCGGTYSGDNLIDDFSSCNSAIGDPDGDGFWFTCDNCPDDSNNDQADCNGNGIGDACDQISDKDGDGCCDPDDACPNDPRKCANEGQCGCGEDEIDTDGDGCMDCVDECPNDPNKCEPGICGCGSSHDDGKDNDGDGVLNCVDQCAGADDAVFAPGCKGAIPTVSEWGLVVLALLLLVAGKVYFGRRTATA